MKIAVFVDYWNFQLDTNSRVGHAKGIAGYRSKIDWKNLGPILAQEAATTLALPPNTHSFAGTYIYTSYNPKTDADKGFKNWATTWLARQPAVTVNIRERKSKAPPRCPSCHQEITQCPHASCGQPIAGTVEKGVDTLIVTDLIRLAVSNTYDAAVLVSADADMIPAVEFIQTLGKRIVHAAFPPAGVHLSTKCWASFDVLKMATPFESQMPAPSSKQVKK